MRLSDVVDPLGIAPRVTRLPGRAAEAGYEASSRLALASLARALDSRIAADAFDVVLRSSLLDRAVRSAVAEQLVERALDSPRTTALVGRVVESEATERIVAQVLDSSLIDASVARVLASDELWLVVGEIARSPAVTEAIARQGTGLADQVAGEVGERSRKADARLERFARRFMHRAPRIDEPATAWLGRAGPT